MFNRASWIWMLASAALLSAAIAHASELALERARAFGDVPAPYFHVAQGPVVAAGLLMLAIGLFMIADRLFHPAAGPASDWTISALEAIRDTGLPLLVLRLGTLQLWAFTLAELMEERLSGYGGGLAAIFGAGHESALVIQLVTSLTAALLLRLFARWLTANARVIVERVRALITSLPRSAASVAASAARRFMLDSFCAPLPALARRIANRPPPFSASLA